VWLDEAIIAEMSAAGSILLIGIGFNLVVETKIKIANMIPAIFLPWPLMVIYRLLPLLSSGSHRQGGIIRVSTDGWHGLSHAQPADLA
jgi:hypothetical protein